MPHIPQPKVTLLKTQSITQCQDEADNSQDKFYEKVKPFMIYVYIYSKTIYVVNIQIVENKLLNMMSMTSIT